MDLIYEPDLAGGVFTKLILSVHQQKSSLCRFLLAKIEQGQRCSAHLINAKADLSA